MTITNAELYILSYYRVCELSGSILFGKLALHTNFDEYRVPLTRHCLEEAKHAWMWTDTIERLGEIPLKVTDSYQTEYGKLFGMPKDLIEIFCLTQVFEKRTLQHFSHHLKMPNINPLVKKTLEDMIAEEAGHVSWIKDELDTYKKKDKEKIRKCMQAVEEADAKVYSGLLKKEPFKDYFSHIA